MGQAAFIFPHAVAMENSHTVLQRKCFDTRDRRNFVGNVAISHGATARAFRGTESLHSPASLKICAVPQRAHFEGPNSDWNGRLSRCFGCVGALAWSVLRMLLGIDEPLPVLGARSAPGILFGSTTLDLAVVGG